MTFHRREYDDDGEKNNNNNNNNNNNLGDNIINKHFISRTSRRKTKMKK